LALKQQNERLRNENKLMLTAWYDFGSRLQYSSAHIQRKNDSPKGWIGRQRIAVNASNLVC